MAAVNVRKRWAKPVLITLGRGKPEESVLMACKRNLNQCGDKILPSLILGTS